MMEHGFGLTGTYHRGARADAFISSRYCFVARQTYSISEYFPTTIGGTYLAVHIWVS